MASEVFDNCPVRVVRDEDAGHYYLQVGVGGVFRTFGGFKLGKLDQLRREAEQQQSQQQLEQPAQG